MIEHGMSIPNPIAVEKTGDNEVTITVKRFLRKPTKHVLYRNAFDGQWFWKPTNLSALYASRITWIALHNAVGSTYIEE